MNGTRRLVIRVEPGDISIAFEKGELSFDIFHYPGFVQLKNNLCTNILFAEAISLVVEKKTH